MPSLKPAVAKANRAKSCDGDVVQVCPACRRTQLWLVGVRIGHADRVVTATWKCGACGHIVIRIDHTSRAKRPTDAAQASATAP